MASIFLIASITVSGSDQRFLLLLLLLVVVLQWKIYSSCHRSYFSFVQRSARYCHVVLSGLKAAPTQCRQIPLLFPTTLRTVALTRGSVHVHVSQNPISRFVAWRASKARIKWRIGLPSPDQEKTGSSLLTVGKNPTTLLPAST